MKYTRIISANLLELHTNQSNLKTKSLGWYNKNIHFVGGRQREDKTEGI